MSRMHRREELQKEACIFPVRIEDGTIIVTIQHIHNDPLCIEVSVLEFRENLQAFGHNRPNFGGTGSDVRLFHDSFDINRRKGYAKLFVNRSEGRVFKFADQKALNGEGMSPI